MNTEKLADLHEVLGNEYLDTMDAYGVRRPPPVAWETRGANTVAHIFWEDEPNEVVRGFPRDMLTGEVGRRVLLRLAGRN